MFRFWVDLWLAISLFWFLKSLGFGKKFQVTYLKQVSLKYIISSLLLMNKLESGIKTLSNLKTLKYRDHIPRKNPHKWYTGYIQDFSLVNIFQIAYQRSTYF